MRTPGIYRRINLSQKSQHFELGTLSQFGDLFAADDASCITRGYYPEVLKPEPFPQTSSDQFKVLGKKYKLSEESLKFLSDKPFLADALLIALSPLKTAFGGRLKPKAEILEEGTSQKLFITISSKLSVEEAVSALGRFDSDWWFNQPARIRGLMEFTLEFK